MTKIDVSKIKKGAEVLFKTKCYAENTGGLILIELNGIAAWINSDAIVSFENPVEEPKVGEIWKDSSSRTRRVILEVTETYVIFKFEDGSQLYARTLTEFLKCYKRVNP